MSNILNFPLKCTCSTIFTESLCLKSALEAKAFVLSKINMKEIELEVWCSTSVADITRKHTDKNVRNLRFWRVLLWVINVQLLPVR